MFTICGCSCFSQDRHAIWLIERDPFSRLDEARRSKFFMQIEMPTFGEAIPVIFLSLIRIASTFNYREDFVDSSGPKDL
jgi:hypothetical protein